VRDASLVIVGVCSTMMDPKSTHVAVVVVEDVAEEVLAADVVAVAVEAVEILVVEDVAEEVLAVEDVEILVVEDVADRMSPAKIQDDALYLPLMRNLGHC